MRKPAEIFLVLDRSGSMQDPPDGADAATRKWDIVVPALNQVITSTNDVVSWGMKTFPEGVGSYCLVTDTIDVPMAAANAAAVTGAVTATTANGDGTPTGAAVRAATRYLQSLDAAGNTNQKYILLATDGEPSCVNGEETGQDEARPDAVAAVTEAANLGYHTFVVGVSTTKENATLALNAMAIAGLEPRPEVNPLATKFYLANTQAELVSALQAVTGAVLDCRFALNEPPAPGERVGVILGTERIPPEQWTFTDATKTTIEVSGAACDAIKTENVASVEIVYGCPDDPIY